MNENKICPVGTKVQSLIFSKEKFTENSAKEWAENHNYKFGYADEKEETFRIRQKNPKYFDSDSFRTIDITDGIQAVIACPKKKMEDGGEFVFITDRQVNDECVLELVELIRSEKSISSWFIDKIAFNLVIVFDNEIMIDDVLKFEDILLKLDSCHDVFKPEITFEYNKETKVILIPLLTDDISVGEFEDGGDVKGKLQTKVTGSLFKGETWEYLVNQVPEYFFKTFNSPLGLENRSNVLSENFTNYYGENDIEKFLQDYKKYPNATIFIKASGYTTKLPKFVSDYLYDILNQNKETLQGGKEQESTIDIVSENKVNEIGIIANVNTLNIFTEKGRFGATTYPKAFEQLKEYRDSLNDQYKIKVSLNPLVMPTEDANTIYRKLKKYANDYEFDISVNLIENDKGEIEDIEYPEGKSYIYLINRNYKKNDTDKMENKYDYNNLIKIDDVKIIDAHEGDNVKIISFIWNDNFYKWRYSFSKTSGSIHIRKYPTLKDLENSNIFGRTHNEGVLIYNTYNSEQTTDEGNYIEFSISKWDKKTIFSESVETLQGGKADKLTIEDIATMHNVSVEYANEQLNKGIKIESEHTSDIEKQKEIALDHLSEFIEYYNELEKMEEKLKEKEIQQNIINKQEMDEQVKGIQINTPIVDNWNDVPKIWKNINKVKQVNFSNNPYNKELIRLLTPFSAEDNQRPVMSGIHFDSNGITVTDAKKLISLPYPNKDYTGTYATIPKKFLKDSAEVKKDLFSVDYPKYENVIPNIDSIEKTYKFNVYKLLQYVNVAFHYDNPTIKSTTFAVGDGKVSVNLEFIKDILQTALKLGHEYLYAHFTENTNTRPVIFSDSETYKLGENTIFLLMPVFNPEKTLGSSDIDMERALNVYYDFSKDEIINKDSSIADFRMNYGEYDVLESDDVSLIKSILPKSPSINVLEYFKVQDGNILATNLQSFVTIKNTNLKDGLYQVIDNAIEYNINETLKNYDDYPKKDMLSESRLKFIINSYVLLHYLKIAFEFTSDDDLRPVMKGVLFDYIDKKLFLASTNGHFLYRVNITKFIEINDDQNDFQFIADEDLLKCVENLRESALIISATSEHISLENENVNFITKKIDGKYPNYKAVIPITSTKKLNFNIKDLYNCVKDKDAVNYIKANKKDVKIYDVVKSNNVSEIKFYQYERGGFEPKNELKICDINYSLENGEFYTNDNLILLMPLKIDTKSNYNFAFEFQFFESVLDNINCENVDIYYSTTNRAYIFGGDCFGYETTIKHKKQEQKKSKEISDIVNEEQKQIKEAIDALSALSSIGGNEEEIKEWNDAIETLKLLLDENTKFDDGGEMKEYRMENGGNINFVPITTPL